MIAASHIIVGAATGAVCKRAWIAVPVAFLSHFVLDQIPHSAFNMFHAAASSPVGMLVIAGKVVDVALIVVAAVLVWRLPTRWVCIAGGLAAWAPDPLSYQPPINGWFALLPGSSLVPWAHRAFHCDVTLTHPLLGFATQVVVIGLGLYLLARRPTRISPKTAQQPEA